MRNPPRPLLDRLRDRAKSWAVCSDDRGLAVSDITEAIGQIEYLTSYISEGRNARAAECRDGCCKVTQPARPETGDVCQGTPPCPRCLVVQTITNVDGLRIDTETSRKCVHQSCTQPCPDCGRRPPGPQCGKVVQRITNVDGLRIDTETLPACLQRTDADYAMQHAGYLATAATEFMDACNAFEEAREKHEDAEPGAEAAAAYDVMFAAQEAHSEAWSGLRTAVYEFEKRRDRALRHQVGRDDELKAAATALYKWLIAVPFQEPPMKRFSIPDEVWEPFQDALFDSQFVAGKKP